MPVDDTAWKFDDLTVTRTGQLNRLRPAIRMGTELLDVRKYALNQFACGCGFIKSDVVGNGIEIVESRLSPDYFNHRAMRFLASA